MKTIKTYENFLLEKYTAGEAKKDERRLQDMADKKFESFLDPQVPSTEEWEERSKEIDDEYDRVAKEIDDEYDRVKQEKKQGYVNKVRYFDSLGSGLKDLFQEVQRIKCDNKTELVYKVKEMMVSWEETVELDEGFESRKKKGF